jgi:hypothetical protein
LCTRTALVISRSPRHPLAVSESHRARVVNSVAERTQGIDRDQQETN